MSKAIKDTDWQADRARYGEKPWLREQSIWAIWLYRFGRRNDQRKDGLRKKLVNKFYWLTYRVIETLTGCSFNKEVKIGPGLLIHHFGNIMIHSKAKIGANCVLRHGVTIGERVVDGPVPVIGDDVEFGAYAQVLGGITVGDGAKIGAMSVVMQDVPPGHTAVGIPARILPPKTEPTKQPEPTEQDKNQSEA